MDSKKSNKIRDIVRLQQILKKWRKNANASKNNSNINNNNNTNTNSNSNSNITYTNTNSNTTCINTSTSINSANKGIKFLKKTLSFSDNTFSSVSSSLSTENNSHVPKGYLAVCVGKELKRYVIPTDYLGHQAFGILLREAEEEFGFHQEGVLKIPCDVEVFEKILKMVQHNKNNDNNHNNMNEYFLHHVDNFEFHASDIDVMSSSLSTGCCSPDCEQLLQPSLPQLCR